MNRAQGSGFTLVEVLATLALMAIILPVAMHGISLATAAASTARRQMEAACIAESKLAELLAGGDWQGTELSGDFDGKPAGYQWSAQVDDWEEDVLRQVRVSVSWTSRGAEREVTVATLVYIGGQ